MSLAVAGLLFVPHLTRAQDAVGAPAQKQIGAAKTEMVPSRIVTNERGATVPGSVLAQSTTAAEPLPSWNDGAAKGDRQVRARNH